MIKGIVFFIISSLLLSCQGQESKYMNYSTPLIKLLDQYNLDSNKISILIDKSDYKLSVLYDTIIVKEYPVVFGSNPVDDKLMQGDACTPEGNFRILSKYPHQSWSKFIWINYPNDESRRKHNSAKQKGLIAKSANIGGEIGIHGVPNGINKLIDLKYNWTLGCISLKNDDVNEVYRYIVHSTDIVIRK